MWVSVVRKKHNLCAEFLKIILYLLANRIVPEYLINN